MSEKRRDQKGRVLHTGESQRKDGRYAFKYTDVSGEVKFVYSWRLDVNDKLPSGKRACESLRELEREIAKKLDGGISPSAGKITILELAKKHIQLKGNVSYSTRQHYYAILNLIANDSFATVRIDKLRPSDAKAWLLRLYEAGKGPPTLSSLCSFMRQAYNLAIEDDLIQKNPFSFKFGDVIKQTTHTRVGLTNEQEAAFLEFIKSDRTYAKYYDPIFVLLNTGLRISEFCGLTIQDIHFDEMYIDVNKQLLLYMGNTYHAVPPKTNSGVRRVPMTTDVAGALRAIIEKRKVCETEMVIDGYSGFIMLARTGKPFVAIRWDALFDSISKKYNELHKKDPLKVTPHICRHTFCTKMVRAGINPKMLQYIMGHGDISVTYNTYTHISPEDARDEMLRVSSQASAT